MSQKKYAIEPMTPASAEAVARLADELIGLGYFSTDQVLDCIERSTVSGQTTSLIARSSSGLIGFRLTLPPGRWSRGRGESLSPELWPAPLEETAYFQSAFVHPDWSRQGVGSSMAAAALEVLARVGARAVVAHSWKESPGGSSQRYLAKLGFEPVAEYAEYWKEVDYVCPRCGAPCLCTAVEMVRALPLGSARGG